MLFLSVIAAVNALAIEPHTPTIMIAQRTISGPFVHRQGNPFDALLFERFFKDRVPMAIHTVGDHQGLGPAQRSEGHGGVIYKARKPVSERVRDSDEYSNAENSVGDSKISFPRDVKRHPYLRILLFVLAILVAGVVGYHFGKMRESRNYVRVPGTN